MQVERLEAKLSQEYFEDCKRLYCFRGAPRCLSAPAAAHGMRPPPLQSFSLAPSFALVESVTVTPVDFYLSHFPSFLSLHLHDCRLLPASVVT